jgi:hypothetical protein
MGIGPVRTHTVIEFATFADAIAFNPPPGQLVYIASSPGVYLYATGTGFGTLDASVYVPPAPVITAIDPTSRVVAPTTDVTLHVYGTGFTSESIIRFGGHSERTVLVSASELTTIITGMLFTGVDPAVPVQVITGDDESNIVMFAFTARPASTLGTTEPAGYDPGEHTVDEVKAYVEAHPDERQAVLDAETAGKARSTLLAWLEEPTGE